MATDELRSPKAARILARFRPSEPLDEAFTAPHHGFRDASDYYYRASAMRVIDRIRVPALIITAEDDPFVPPEPFRDPSVTRNPNITLVLSEHGGHCGFVGEPDGEDDGYWAEQTIVEFVERCAETQDTARDAAVSGR